MLSPGAKLGSYEILSPLGAGGMGEVYLARDTKLNRQVAIKGLPDAFARDPQRLARFQREAQVLAALNHPNIAAIYGLEESGGAQFLVMEYVAGEPLRGPVDVAEALALAKQLAEALEAAHEKGIVHRDLKPDNIKVTPEGKVKVLDFGLAKALEESGDVELLNSPTLSVAATRAGMILGTAAYMSPEQARGKPVDRRADVWAFGGVLYELLTGKRAFTGETVTDLTVAIMTKEPDWSLLPAATPPRVRELLQRCLQKDPQRRLKHLGDVLWEMDQPVIVDAPVVDASSSAPIAAAGAKTARWPWMVAAAAVLALAAGLWIYSRWEPPAESWTAVRLGGPSVAWGPRLSPDGKMLAFLVFEDRQSQVAVMNPESGNWTVLTHDRTRGIVNRVSWSRDSSRIYFDRNASAPNGIYSVPALGGDEQLVAEASGEPAVLPDGSLLVVRTNARRQLQIHRFWPETGRLEALNGEFPASFGMAALAVFPDGKEAAFFGRPVPSRLEDPLRYYALDLLSGTTRPLGPDLKAPPGFSEVAVTPDGQSVLATEGSGDLTRLVEIPRSGRGRVRPLVSLQAATWGLDVGPDGSIYVDQVERSGDVLRFSASGGVPEKLAPAPADNSPSLLLPDGRLLLYSSAGGRSHMMAARPGKDPTPFVQTEENSHWPFVVTGQGEIAFDLGSAPDQTLAIASASDGRMIRRLPATKGLVITCLAASPDGRTLYYAAAGNIWSIPTAGGDPRKITAADEVVADPGGRQLLLMRYEKDGDHLLRLSLPDGVETPIALQSPFRLITGLAPNAVHPDGRILVGVQSPDSWWDEVGILDPKTGKVQKLDIPYAGDVDYPGWTRDGKIMAQGFLMRSSLWRFRKEKP